MAKRLTSKQGFSETSVSKVPKQSGIYVLVDQKNQPKYVGMAGARRLQERLKEHLTKQDIPGVTHFRVLPTSSVREAEGLEVKYIKQLKPKYNVRGAD